MCWKTFLPGRLDSCNKCIAYVAICTFSRDFLAEIWLAAFAGLAMLLHSPMGNSSGHVTSHIILWRQTPTLRNVTGCAMRKPRQKLRGKHSPSADHREECGSGFHFESQQKGGHSQEKKEKKMSTNTAVSHSHPQQTVAGSLHRKNLGTNAAVWPLRITAKSCREPLAQNISTRSAAERRPSQTLSASAAHWCARCQRS